MPAEQDRSRRETAEARRVARALEEVAIDRYQAMTRWTITFALAVAAVGFALLVSITAMEIFGHGQLADFTSVVAVVMIGGALFAVGTAYGERCVLRYWRGSFDRRTGRE